MLTSRFPIDWNRCASSELINYFLVLLRFHFAFANRFYRLDLCLTFLFSVYSLLVVLLSLLLFSVFEVLFKELFLISISFNVHSYFLFSSLFLSILFILLTTHSLFHLILLSYSQQQFQQTNQVSIDLSLNTRGGGGFHSSIQLKTNLPRDTKNQKH